jgi:hypothetical protein
MQIYLRARPVPEVRARVVCCEAATCIVGASCVGVATRICVHIEQRARNRCAISRAAVLPNPSHRLKQVWILQGASVGTFVITPWRSSCVCSMKFM